MGAEALDQRVGVGAGPEKDEVLAQQAHGPRWTLFEFAGGGDGMPVAAQQVAHGRAGADLGQRLVLFLAEHFEANYRRRFDDWSTGCRGSYCLRVRLLS